MSGTFIKLSKFVLNRGALTATLDAEIKRQIRQASREFFKVASESVPIRTGFARGAFANLLEAIGGAGSSGSNPAANFIKSVAVTSSAKFRTGRGRNIKYNIPEEYYQGHVLKTPTSGRAYATPPESIFEVNDWQYSFNFEIAITYFEINDTNANPRTPSSPWHAFEKGREAYLTYMKTEGLRKLPKVNDFLTTVQVTKSF